MFSPEGPTLRELAVQALSSVEHGYDLLAPKFDHTPFRTPESVLDATAAVLEKSGPYGEGLDLCCGTGAGLGVLAGICQAGVTGVDFSAGMLEEARGQAPEGVRLVRADVRQLPFGEGAFDLVVSFGALGHFLPAELPGLFGRVHEVLRPGGTFALPVAAPPKPASAAYWALTGFDAVMRVRNALWRPPFVMYYRAFRLGDLQRELTAAGFRVTLRALPGFEGADGSPRAGLIEARKVAGRG